MIRKTTKEDDEAQNLMLLEMDPATIPTKRPGDEKRFPIPGKQKREYLQ
uniref:Uncharacterized protein n=1 Tax=Romanomermis culicivorax TaxID=13658 RepID=A0A915LEN2_ROMCU